MMVTCYNHKNIETVLSCSRCNKPVCNKCTIDSFVGIKCKDCGSIGKPAILNISFSDILRVLSLSLIFSFFVGFIYSLILVIILNIDLLGNIQSTALMSLRIITLIFLVFFGVVNGELVKRLSRNKLNRIFPIISAFNTLILWLVIFYIFSSIFFEYQIWWYQFFYQPVAMLGLGIAIYLSYTRVK